MSDALKKKIVTLYTLMNVKHVVFFPQKFYFFNFFLRGQRTSAIMASRARTDAGSLVTEKKNLENSVH